MSTVILPKLLANFSNSLAATMSASATTCTLSTSTDPDGSSLSGLYEVTFDEGTSSEEHMYVTFTGASGAVSRRGLSKVDGWTEVSGNKYRHDRGASVKITDISLLLISRLLNGTDTFNAVDWLGVNSISGLATPSSGETTKAANVDYVNGVSIAGAPDAALSVKGITKLSVAPASATAPIAVGDNDPRVPSSAQTTLLASITADSAEINKLDGLTATQAQLNEAGTFFGSTDITGAEAETLTDGSDASSKHYHGVAILSATRAANTASGTQTIAHGLGRTPKFIQVTVSLTDGNGAPDTCGILSQGYSDGTNHACSYITSVSNGASAGYTQSGSSSTRCIYMSFADTSTTGGSQEATASFDATNISLAWTLTSGGILSNNMNITIVAH